MVGVWQQTTQVAAQGPVVTSRQTVQGSIQVCTLATEVADYRPAHMNTVATSQCTAGNQVTTGQWPPTTGRDRGHLRNRKPWMCQPAGQAASQESPIVFQRNSTAHLPSHVKDVIHGIGGKRPPKQAAETH